MTSFDLTFNAHHLIAAVFLSYHENFPVNTINLVKCNDHNSLEQNCVVICICSIDIYNLLYTLFCLLVVNISNKSTNTINKKQPLQNYVLLDSYKTVRKLYSVYITIFNNKQYINLFLQ